MSLTDAAIKAAKPADKVQEKKDGRGLFLIVSPHGHKSWVLRFKDKGQSRRATLGVFDPRIPDHVGVAAARAKAAQFKADFRAGRFEPKILTGEPKTPAKTPDQGILLREAWAEYMRLAGNKLARPKEIQVTYDQVLSHMGEKPLASITEDDLTDALQAKYDKMIEAGRTGRGIMRLRVEIGVFFKWCRVEGRSITKLKHNPMTDVPVIARTEARSRWLNEDELGWCLLAIRNVGGDFAKPLELALRAGLRVGNAFDLTKAMVVVEDEYIGAHLALPGSVMKNGEDFVVPLVPQIAALLPDLEGFKHGEKLWRSSRDGFLDKDSLSKPKTRIEDEMSRLAAASGRNEPIDPWVIHDWRRSIRSLMSKMKVWGEVSEAVLAHKPKGIEGVYNQWRYVDEKREALTKWNDLLDRAAAKFAK